MKIKIKSINSKKTQFFNGEIYHIFNRGVEKRNIFQQVSDYFRFIFCLYECNDKNPVVMRDRIDERKKRKIKIAIGDTYGNLGEKSKREPLVEILVFCLMPNHYHLVVRQLVDGGISLFLKKLGNAYVGYFNEKYDRKGMGSLFQGSFKAIHVKTNSQLMGLVCYVFTNPVEIIEKAWKESGIKNSAKAIKHLESYRWSSYLDCIGKENFPSVTKRDFIFKVFDGLENIKKSVNNLVLHKSELRKGINKIKPLVLD